MAHELRDEFIEAFHAEINLKDDEVVEAIEKKNGISEKDLAPLIRESNRDIELIGFISAVLLIIVLAALYL